MPPRPYCRSKRETLITVTTLHPPLSHPLARLLLQMGSYHYVSGIDTSSSASLAAYINSLTYSIEESQAWFTKGPTWKVKNGCFWCVLYPGDTHPPALIGFVPSVCTAMQLFRRVFTCGRARRCQDTRRRECIRHRPTRREVHVLVYLTPTFYRLLLPDIKLLPKSGKKHISPPSSARSSTLTTRTTSSRLIVD